jgi:hypothetical protein
MFPPFFFRSYFSVSPPPFHPIMTDHTPCFFCSFLSFFLSHTIRRIFVWISPRLVDRQIQERKENDRQVGSSSHPKKKNPSVIIVSKTLHGFPSAQATNGYHHRNKTCFFFSSSSRPRSFLIAPSFIYFHQRKDLLYISLSLSLSFSAPLWSSTHSFFSQVFQNFFFFFATHVPLL